MLAHAKQNIFFYICRTNHTEPEGEVHVIVEKWGVSLQRSDIKNMEALRALCTLCACTCKAERK